MKRNGMHRNKRFSLEDNFLFSHPITSPWMQNMEKLALNTIRILCNLRTRKCNCIDVLNILYDLDDINVNSMQRMVFISIFSILLYLLI